MKLTSNWLKKSSLYIFLVILFFVTFVLVNNFFNKENGEKITTPEDEVIIDMYKNALAKSQLYFEQNGKKYSGVCETLDNENSLNVTLLRLIKQKGATEVFCYSSDSEFMTKSKLPSGFGFVCIDHTNQMYITLKENEDFLSCSQEEANIIE